MNLNRIELRKIMYDFNSHSNRLMQAAFEDYNNILKKYLRFLSETEIIKAYIDSCGKCDMNLKENVDQVKGSYGNYVFSLGETEEEEVRNIFAILQYVAENNIQIHYGLAWGYSHSKSYQDKVKGFNERVVYVLIGHIDRYLTKIGMEMGMDDHITYNISVRDGMVNIATDNAKIEANNNISSYDKDTLLQLIAAVNRLKEEQDFSEEDSEMLDSSLEVISEELKSEKPRKSFLKTAINSIKVLKGTAEFGAAVVALIQFVQGIIG